MSEIYYIGRKAIIAYLSAFIELADIVSPADKWDKVRRWKKRYGLPIERHLNGKPYIDPDVFERWWSKFRAHKMKQENGCV